MPNYLQAVTAELLAREPIFQPLLDGLVSRAGDEDWIISDAHCRELDANTYALTYQLDRAGRLTRRVTLWRRDPNG
jgi:hypothetical protein